MGNNWGRAFPAVILRPRLGGSKDDKREARLAGKRHNLLRDPFVKQAEAELTVSHRFPHELEGSLAGEEVAMEREPPFVSSALQQIHRRRHIMHTEILCQ
jgi:hypothetical protein